jgi:hypothetical protein
MSSHYHDLPDQSVHHQESTASSSARRRVDHHRQQQPGIHALPNVPLTENFSSFGFGAYAPRSNTNDGGALGISEPNSPITVEGIDHNSNETHSSGENTKIDSRSPSGFRATYSNGKDNGENGYGQYHREVGVVLTVT